MLVLGFESGIITIVQIVDSKIKVLVKGFQAEQFGEDPPIILSMLAISELENQYTLIVGFYTDYIELLSISDITRKFT